MAARQQSKRARQGAVPQGYVVRVRILDAATGRLIESTTVPDSDGRDVWRHYHQAERESWRFLERLESDDRHGRVAPGLTFQIEVERAWGADRRVWR